MADTEYREFRITVLDSTHLQFTKTDSPQSDLYTIPMNEENSQIKPIIDMFNRWLSEPGKITKRDEFELLGTLLFKGLMSSEVEDALRKEWEKAQKEFKPLRLILDFRQGAKELPEMPWEYIYYPDDPNHKSQKGFFLAAHRQLVLVRYISSSESWDDETVQEAEKRPLSILIVVSQPDRDEDGTRLGEVKHDVITTIERLKRRSHNAIDTHKLLQPTKRKLKEAIEQFRPHVLHFIGHGRFKENEGALALVKENKEKNESIAFWINDADLADYFVHGMIYRPRLVFLHACEGADSTSDRAFSGVALQLIYSRIPAVIAMHYQVENEVADRFAEAFYARLSQGDRIDEAVRAGREELGEYLEDRNFSNRAFGIPVVYLRATRTTMRIISVPEQPGIATAEGSSSVSAVLRCPNCSQEVKPDYNYCPKCNWPLSKCPNCNSVMPKVGRCIKCGYDPKAETAGDRVRAVPVSTPTRRSRQSSEVKVRPEQPLSPLNTPSLPASMRDMRQTRPSSGLINQDSTG
jgi:hypothetical protein